MRGSLEALAPFHLIGGGGIGMSALARILLAGGHEVSASDREDSSILQALAASGAKISVGHDGDRMPMGGTVVVSSAIRETNPELAEAYRRGIPVIHRAQLLAMLCEPTTTIAVTGTHGKSTTSAMIAHILSDLGTDPTAILGAEMRSWGSNARIGSGWTVAEADESDGSMCWMSPQVAVVTNVESDHLDHYRDLDEILASMASFVAGSRPDAILVASSDDEGSRRLLELIGGSRQVLTFGSAGDLVIDRDGFSYRGTGISFRPPMPGRHNLANAAAAILAVTATGADPASAASALSSFPGTVRRFELRGHAAGVAVIDDYAHHPTEVSALLAGCRESHPDARIIAVFEPHLFSRTRDHAEALRVALSAADHGGVLPIYPAREDPIEGVSSAILTSGTDLVPLSSFAEAAGWAARLAQPGDVILTIGAGPVTGLAPMILEALEQR